MPWLFFLHDEHNLLTPGSDVDGILGDVSNYHGVG
jgi:hypothetical protein